MISLNSNAALCSLKLNDFESCIKYADVALDYDLKYVKALYAKGKVGQRNLKIFLAEQFHTFFNYILYI